MELQAASWQATDDAATLRCGPFSARIATRLPAQGLSDLRWSTADGEASLEARLFSVETDAGVESQPADTYVRGADFVSTQSGTNEFPFRTQAYWSAVRLADEVVAATLTLSLQTNLLDSAPRVAVVSDLGAFATAIEITDEASLVARTADGHSLIIAPHPSDTDDAEVSVDGSVHRLWLRPPFLEKGVIRRFRIGAFVCGSGADAAALPGALEAFADLPIPLTT